MSDLLFSRFTSSTGPLTKVLSLSPDGKLVKTASAQMYLGAFETMRISTNEPHAGPRTAAALTGWGSNQALSPSVCLTADSGKVVTQRVLQEHPGAVARDAKHFGYRADAIGLCVLDFDAQKDAKPPSPAEIRAVLLKIWPALEGGIVLHWVSGSSLIYTRDGSLLVGISGQRVYIGVRSQADIPRTVKVVNQRAWLLGLGGHVHVSESGAKLVRGLFDSAMGDAGGRLDFAPAGAVCTDGLEQRRGPPEVWFDVRPIDSRATLPDLSAAEEAEVAALIEEAKRRAEPEAQAKRAAWLASRQQAAAIEAAKRGNDPEEARRRVEREHAALIQGVLMGSAEVIHVDDNGTEHRVLVDQLLKSPKEWHGKRFLSPHDENHRHRSADAMAYLLQPSPKLFDLNDLVTYSLQPQPVRLQVVAGNKAQLAQEIATELASRSDLMNVAGQLSRVVNGEFAPVSRPILSFIIGTHCALYRSTKEGKTAPVDIDQPTVDMVHALLTERAGRVKGRSSIPLIDCEGRIIASPGLDTATGIYLEVDADAEPVSLSPTRAQAVEALRRAWHPWSLYGWETPHDRAAMLATVLTVPLRPTIDAAPGLFGDGALQSLGKSSAIGAVLVLVQGHRGGMKTWTNDSEVENEKYLLSLARSGAPAVAYDNVVGTFDSAAIASAVIEGRVSARVLGSNTAASPTFRAMWLASGNNSSMGRDCSTRFLQARIACPDGQPQRRAFPFEPSEAARADRMGIVHSILILHRAWHAAGRPMADGISTRFPQWGRTVRPLVQWLQSAGIAAEAGLDELGDPADSILNRASASDPDAEASSELFRAIADQFGSGTPFTAGKLARVVRLGKDSPSSKGHELWDAVSAFFPRTFRAPSAQSLSSVMKHRRDRVYDGLKLVALPKTSTRDAARSGQLFAVIEA
jgi:hypothetical protein